MPVVKEEVHQRSCILSCRVCNPANKGEIEVFKACHIPFSWDTNREFAAWLRVFRKAFSFFGSRVAVRHAER